MQKFNSQPIPGANYTSDTKNYPWRQPPEYTDVNEALDYLARRITKFKVANGILNFAEAGVPLYKIASMILTLGLSEGKWTVDYMILLAGPLTRMIELMCIGFEIEYKLGIEDDMEDFETVDFFKNELELKSPNPKAMKIISEEMPEIKQEAENQSGEQKTPDIKTQGFMAMTSKPKEPMNNA